MSCYGQRFNLDVFLMEQVIIHKNEKLLMIIQSQCGLSTHVFVRAPYLLTTLITINLLLLLILLCKLVQ